MNGPSKIMIFSSLVVTAFTQPQSCYDCTNNPNGDGPGRPYDPNCGDLNYSGDHTIATGTYANKCATVIWADGYITRTNFNKDIGDGGCYYSNDHMGERMDCVCTSADLCNTGSYCEQCSFPFPTSHATTSTTEVTPTFPSDSLACYSCYNCPEVDENTQVIQEPNIVSCVSTIFFNSGTVIRGGTQDDMNDGECSEYNENATSLSCWCKSPLCNDQNMTPTTTPITTTTTTEATTTIPKPLISCYSCFDCSEVDENTPVIQDPEVASCVTTIFLSSGTVTRGGTNNNMIDGECLQDSEGFESLSCWCNSSLCNDQSHQTVQQLLEHQKTQ